MWLSLCVRVAVSLMLYAGMSRTRQHCSIRRYSCLVSHWCCGGRFQLCVQCGHRCKHWWADNRLVDRVVNEVSLQVVPTVTGARSEESGDERDLEIEKILSELESR